MAKKPDKTDVPKPNVPPSIRPTETDGRTGDSSTETEREAARTGEFDKLEREVRDS